MLLHWFKQGWEFGYAMRQPMGNVLFTHLLSTHGRTWRPANGVWHKCWKLSMVCELLCDPIPPKYSRQFTCWAPNYARYHERCQGHVTYKTCKQKKNLMQSGFLECGEVGSGGMGVGRKIRGGPCMTPGFNDSHAVRIMRSRCAVDI